MSIELGFDDNGNTISPWGVIEYGDPRPDRNEVGHLMLVTRDYFGQLFKEGPQCHHGALHSVNAVPEDEIVTEDTCLRLFAYADYFGKRWTWELFEAHWDDGGGPDIYLGRWPD